MPLKDKVFIVTGGTRGIGRGIVGELAKEGARVAFTYVSQDKLADELVRELKKEGRQALSFKADVRDFERARQVVEKTIETFGQLDGLVNNAGITRDKPLMMMEPSDWRDVIETNLLGTIHFSRAAIVPMMKQKQGEILNVSSVAGIVGRPGQTNYAASKAGIIGFSKALAKEVARYNVHVNVLAPGFIDTEMVQQVKEEQRKGFLDEIPLGRFGSVQEVARMALFLLSGERYITGQVFCIDGGMVMV